MGTLRIALEQTQAQFTREQIPLAGAPDSQSMTTSGTAATSTVVAPADFGGIKYVWTLAGSDNGQWVKFSTTSPPAAASVGDGHYVPAGMRTLAAKEGQSLSAIDA